MALLDNPYILVRDGKISSISDLLPGLEQVLKASRPLFITPPKSLTMRW